MGTVIQNIPREITKELKIYKPYLSKPQYKHFTTLVSGLILSENKTIQEINDNLPTDNDQSSLNRSLANWDTASLNKRRVQRMSRISNKGFFIIDDTLAHKTGKKIEYANYHYSNLNKKKEYGHSIVTSFFSSNHEFPIDNSIYVRKDDKPKKFKTKREHALEHLDLALEAKLKFFAVLADSWYFSKEFIQELKYRGQNHVLAIKSNKKISINRNERISVSKHADSLEKKDFKRVVIDEQVHFYHATDVYLRGIGMERLIVCRKKYDKEFKFLITDLDWDDRSIISVYLRRNAIEGYHRDAKQHLGLEDYQLQDFSKIHSVVLAVLVAYTILILTKLRVSFFGRFLKTLGEVCRYLRLLATKGIRWLNKIGKIPYLFKKILNRFVLVKNAKV